MNSPCMQAGSGVQLRFFNNALEFRSGEQSEHVLQISTRCERDADERSWPVIRQNIRHLCRILPVPTIRPEIPPCPCHGIPVLNHSFAARTCCPQGLRNRDGGRRNASAAAAPPGGAPGSVARLGSRRPSHGLPDRTGKPASFSLLLL
jgi:hypothetical protein